jgi:hypothetical protein
MKLEDDILTIGDVEISGITDGYRLLHSYLSLMETDEDFNSSDDGLKELERIAEHRSVQPHKELLRSVSDYFSFRANMVSLTGGGTTVGAGMLSSFYSDVIALKTSNGYRLDAVRYGGDYALPLHGDWSFGKSYIEQERSFDFSSNDELYLVTQIDKWVFNEIGQVSLVSVLNPEESELNSFLKFLQLNDFLDNQTLEMVLNNFMALQDKRKQ